ncbi:MAG: ATP-binding protein, partial [Rhodanobacteraceae bacterium]
PDSLRTSLSRLLPATPLFACLADRARDGATLKQLDAGEFNALRTSLLHAGFRDAAIVPLFDRYEPMGALLALSKKAGAFDRDSVHFMQSVANILAAAVQRSRSEEQLAHSQRLDAIGQLTGGIAHDFNNLLTVISGNLQLLEGEIADYSNLRETVDSACRAVDRGAVLTRKLLAFARRQRLSPRAVQPSLLLADLKLLLHRTLGERIAVAVECPPRTPPVFADSGELDAALLNLALNARDAMPRGGNLTIRARHEVVDPDNAELPVGPYVVFTVLDTGSGMVPEILARALEPFFTTKELGKGNGLGLSMVYGFVKQSGGHITIDSKPGQGTQIELYLPVAASANSTRSDPVPTVPRAGQGAILVVEDEPEVRAIALKFLQSLGYATYEAANAETALELLASHADIELLFSDIVLGSGMTGFDLAREVKRLRPDLPALLTSGYEHAWSAHPENEVGEIEVLRKPYRREQLAVAVRNALRAG